MFALVTATIDFVKPKSLLQQFTKRMSGFTYNVLILQCPRPQHNSDLLRWRISVSGYCHTVIVFFAHWFLWHLGQYQGLCSSKSSLKLVIRCNIEIHLWKRFISKCVKFIHEGSYEKKFYFCHFCFYCPRTKDDCTWWLLFVQFIQMFYYQ